MRGVAPTGYAGFLAERPANLPEFTAGGRALFARRLERMNREERTGRQVRAGEDISWV